MASVRSLTDEELRDKLKEHGILSPVTASTRSILIKKLNHAMAGAKRAAHQQARARRSVTSVTSVTGGGRLHTFSSDEDEDETEDHLRSSSSRATRSFRASRVSRESGASQVRHYDRRNGTSGTARGARASRGSGGRGESVAAAGQPGGGGNTTTSTTTTATDRYRLYFPSVSGRSGLGLQVRSSEDYDTGSDSDPADLAEDSVDRGGGGGDGGGGRMLWAGSAEPPQQQESSPARLQNHMSSGWTRAARPKAHLENGREWAEGEAMGSPSLAECVVSQAEPSRVANGRHHSEGGAECQAAEESTWHYKVPLLLLVLLAVFFGVVAMLYVNMRMPLLPTLRSVPALVSRALASLSLPVPFFTPRTAQWTPPNALPQPALPPAAPPLPHHHTSSQHTENKFPVCSNTLKNNCLTVQAMAQVQPVLGQLEEVVLPALHHQAGLYQCGNAATRHLSVAALQDLLHHHISVSLRSSGVGADVVESLGRLVEWNPHWGLEAVRGEADGVLLGLALSAQPTHILCHITTAIYSFFYLIMGLVTVILTAWLAFSCVRYYRWKAEEEKQQVYELVEQILEVLGGLGGASGKDFVAVNHVRDSLISPRDRRTKQVVWDRAVHFINCNESRVRREIQAVGGEDCEVWRWASGLPHHSHHSPGVDGGDGVGRPPPKVWQGPAFNTQSPHNVPNVSPTSCLKIRNMFDCDVEFGDSWPARIQDSILEKCEGISIVHVAVDRGSREGCVYLKCASLGDSGRAFRALHGWWYDGNLVTVKFLRDERYYQRFPSARHATRRLRPSNNKRLSLQVPAGQPEPPSHT